MVLASTQQQLTRSNPTPEHDNGLNLACLPFEVLQLILSYNYGKPRISISVADTYYSQASTRLLETPKDIAGMTNVLSTSKLLRERAMTCISDNTTFTANTRCFLELPTAFGQANCKAIKNLHLKVFNPPKINDETYQPHLFEMLIKYLPNLEKLLLWCNHENDVLYRLGRDHPYRDLPRQKQDLCLLMGMGAGLQHPNLERMIYPCIAGPTYEETETEIQNQIILDTGKTRLSSHSVTKWMDELHTGGKVKVKDVVLDATLVRHTKKVDIAKLPFEHFILKPETGLHRSDITTSKTPYDHEVYKIFEERYGRTLCEYQDKGWTNRKKDDLLDFSREVHDLEIAEDQPDLKARLAAYLDIKAAELQKATEERDDLRDDLACREVNIRNQDLTIRDLHDERERYLDEIRDWEEFRDQAYDDELRLEQHVRSLEIENKELMKRIEVLEQGSVWENCGDI